MKALKAQLLNLTEEVEAAKEKNLVLEAEIKTLKGQIKKLEEEKQDLQKQLKDVENKCSALIQKVAELEGSNLALIQKVAELEGSNLALIEEVGELEGSNLALEERVDDLEGENKNLKKDVGDLKKENKDLKGDVGVLKSEIEQLKSDNKEPLLLLGEMCFQIPSLMYKMVIPGWHVKSSTYNVQDIEDHIKALGHEESEESKILAQKKWDELKKELNWEAKYSRHLKTVKSTRNTAAHPSIDEESLRKAARDAKENGTLTTYIYYNMVELIGIWEKLVKKQ